MSSIQIPSNRLREHFSRSWMPSEKPLLLPTKVPPWFTSDLSKLALQFKKPVQPYLKLVQPVSRLSLLPVWQSKLLEKSCADIFLKPGSTGFEPGSTDFESGRVSGWVAQWTENFLVETGLTGLRLFQPVFGPLLPTAVSFWGIL